MLDILPDRMTVRELIRTQVEQEVAAFNEQQTEYFQGLIQPTAAELTLNGYRMPRQLCVNPVEQVGPRSPPLSTTASSSWLTMRRSSAWTTSSSLARPPS